MSAWARTLRLFDRQIADVMMMGSECQHLSADEKAGVCLACGLDLLSGNYHVPMESSNETVALERLAEVEEELDCLLDEQIADMLEDDRLWGSEGDDLEDLAAAEDLEYPETRGERRERNKRGRAGMGVSGRSVLTVAEIIRKKAEEARRRQDGERDEGAKDQDA